MASRFEAWRRRFRLWIIPLVFCAVNLGGVLVYRANLAGNVEALQEDVESAEEERDDLRGRRQRSLDFRDSVARRRESERQLYEEYFSTKQERLTKMIREAKKLAVDSQLRPRSITYPEKELDYGDLIQKRMVFPVQGSYDQLRIFINKLELNGQFLTLERVSLGGSQNEAQAADLAIQLELSTIFVKSGTRQEARGGSP